VVLKVSLSYSSMLLGGLFIASRDLVAIGASFGSSQPSISAGAPDYSVAHRTLHGATVNKSMIGHFKF
jgi:hypothetical protein